MFKIYEPFIKNDRHQYIYQKATEVADLAKSRRKKADEEADFQKETLHDLKEHNYVTLTLSKEFGGEEVSLYELLLAQERLAIGDGATALSIGWHLGVMMELNDEPLWDEDVYKKFAQEVADQKKVVNRAASEPATGSPTRGGVPETTAVSIKDGYSITGRKTFTSMASLLDYYIVSAYIEDKDAVGWFLIDSSKEGIDIDYTWDTVGMRGTGSHDLVLQDVNVKAEDLVELQGDKKGGPKGWLLHIPAVYLGIAIAARNDAIEFAKGFQPNSLDRPISEVSHIQDKIGEMEMKLLHARSFMYSVAEQWDQYPERREVLAPSLGAVKTVATNAANEVVDLAMRIAGGRGLSKSYPFEQYYRDVRAGLHNPPMDDMVIQNMAQAAIKEL
ncbi:MULTISPECIES: acyl-CoA dehydrogenase family protein [Pontibacillus]|uniref:Acyl-CoA dehydrogenase family protein n=1 Tax=Pontibacillus chungwhensis TaxID=265426 RepID=A0ABY8UUX6_9BACI|nr:acyl-CoA dehydrogenase family protein [Pontibacillus chungwhensis]MCD5323925.1 acyl-CoA dehydrogenase family protein [Pontibacillus sp. HN14]WIF97279.1 acyl-CoA dehydrogenase family protein [Pontibacillus chungwhensis]